jgi:hypothetical protein
MRAAVLHALVPDELGCGQLSSWPARVGAARRSRRYTPGGRPNARLNALENDAGGSLQVSRAVTA